MSTPSPLLPSGALEGVAAPKSRVRITVLTILALHVVFIGGLLLQGCKENNKNPLASDSSSNGVRTLPPLTDTNSYFTTFPGDRLGSPPSSSNPAQPESPLSPAPSSYSSRPTGSLADLPSPGGAGTDYAPPEASTSMPSLTMTVGQATEHVIKKGDTIGALAKHYGVSERAILDANPSARPRALKINDKLIVPAPTVPAVNAGAEVPHSDGGEVYIVKVGDNLTTIAKKFGVTVKALRTANNMRGDRIRPKQKLVIPPKPGATGGSTTPATF